SGPLPPETDAKPSGGRAWRRFPVCPAARQPGLCTPCPFNEVSTVFVQLTKDFLGHPPGQRIDVAEEQAQLLTQRGIVSAVADDPLAPLVGRATEQLTQRLAESINVALRQFADAQGQSRRVSRPVLFGNDRNGDGNPKKSFGDWLLHVARNDEGYLEKT